MQNRRKTKWQTIEGVSREKEQKVFSKDSIIFSGLTRHVYTRSLLQRVLGYHKIRPNLKCTNSCFTVKLTKEMMAFGCVLLNFMSATILEYLISTIHVLNNDHGHKYFILYFFRSNKEKINIHACHAKNGRTHRALLLRNQQRPLVKCVIVTSGRNVW